VTFLPEVVRAEYRGGHRIHLVFNDRSEKTVDFRRWLTGPVFEPLKKLEYFRRFFIDGGTVVWPNGADIAPETLYEAPGGRTAARGKATRASKRAGGARRARTR
jgi:hypothetical protein